MNIKQEAKYQQWNLSECLCFSIVISVCFKFWISVLISMNLLFVFNFRLSAFCLLFLKLWLIYPGLGVTLSVFIWWHWDWHQMAILRDRPSANTRTFPDFLCFSIATIFCSGSAFHSAWTSLLFLIRLPSTCLLFHKPWLIYPGSRVILSVFIWWHRYWHQIPAVMYWIM